MKFEINKHDYDIICITETWLDQFTTDEIISIPGYDLIRKDRRRQQGGGVLIYYKSELTFNILQTSDDVDLCEFIIAEIRTATAKLVLGVLYRPPNTAYPSVFFNSMSDVLMTYCDFIITGDFNEKMDCVNEINNWIAENELFLVPSDPTCHTWRSDSWIDVYITRKPENVVVYNKSLVPIYEIHDTIDIIYQFVKPKPNPKFFIYRDFSKFDEREFSIDLLNQLERNNEFNYVNEECEFQTESLNIILGKHAPAQSRIISS